MFEITKKYTVAAAHRLPFVEPNSPCYNWHGHTYTFVLQIQRQTLNAEHMVIDFSRLTDLLTQYDHTTLNQHFAFTTCEYIAATLYHRLAEHIKTIDPECILCSVSVWEGANNGATYTN